MAAIALTAELVSPVVIPAASGAASSSSSSSPTTASGATSLGATATSAQKAVENDLADKQLQATYGSGGAQFNDAGLKFSVGTGKVGRAGQMQAVSPTLSVGSSRALYGTGGVTETFTPGETGIEQTFKLADAPAGTGDLTIDVPLTGLSAATGRSCHTTTVPNPTQPAVPKALLYSGLGRPHVLPNETCTTPDGTIELRDSSGQTKAQYSGLHVVDANGQTIPATMHAANDGKTIEIDVSDASAAYPLEVDPTWSVVSELTASDGARYDAFGSSVARTGTTVLVGAPQHRVGGRMDQGAVYVFTKSGGTWAQTAELTPTPGATTEYFGYSVALVGSTAFIGAPLGHTTDGAVYVFTKSGSTWSQHQELVASDAQAGNYFGGSIAVVGTTALIGSLGRTSEEGAAYIFTKSGSTWSQHQELTVSDTANALFGVSVALTGTVAIIGASDQLTDGAAYVFTKSGSTWSQHAELTASDGANHDNFGRSVALSGSNALIGATEWTVGPGTAYIFHDAAGTWSQKSQLTPSNGAGNDEFGFGELVVLSGTMAFASAVGLKTGSYTYTGAIYEYYKTATYWNQLSVIMPVAPTTNYETFGSSMAVAGSTILVGASGQDVRTHPGQGAAYFLTSASLVPAGTPLKADMWGGSSPTEGCGCGTTTANGVDPADGDFSTNMTDLTLSGGGVPLTFTRTYDAQAAQAEEASGSAVPPLGYGWAFNLGMHLGYATVGGKWIATVTDENGAQVKFVPYATRATKTWCTNATNFCAEAPRVLSTLNHNTGGTWTLARTTGSKTTFTFASTGKLTQIKDATGDTLTESSYTPSGGQTACPGSDTCTDWKSSASGRELVLAYDSTGQLRKALDANSTLTVSFGFTGSTCSTWSGSEHADLCKATDPGTRRTYYTYNSSNATADLDYDLLTITPPGDPGKYTNTYNATGRIDKQTDPTTAATTLSYTGTNSSHAGGITTVTTYPEGTGTGKPEDVTLDWYSSNELTNQTSGAGTASSSTQTMWHTPAPLLPVLTQDNDAKTAATTYDLYSTGGTEVSSADPTLVTDDMGNTTQHKYNSSNQAWCTVKPAEYLDTVRCPASAPATPPAPGHADTYPGVTLSFYNATGELTATTDALGNTTLYAYTGSSTGVAKGLKYCTVDPADYQKSVTCPAYGAAHSAGTATETFDAYGDVATTTSAIGAVTTSCYYFQSASGQCAHTAPSTGDGGNPELAYSKTTPEHSVTTYTYNGAGQVLKQVQSSTTYSATTINAYTPEGSEYCTVTPLSYSKGHTSCPATPPSSGPTHGTSPWTGDTITIYDHDTRVLYQVNPLGGATEYAYDQTGNRYCTVAPKEYATAKTCPSLPITAPTVGHDTYLGATVSTFNAEGRVVQQTDPLGDITLDTYDGSGNVTKTVKESTNSSVAPTVTTTTTYNADNQPTSTTVGSGTTASTTKQLYDPDGNVYCTVSPDKSRLPGYQCPPWKPAWASSPPSPVGLYASSSPTATQAEAVSLSFANADGKVVESFDADGNPSVTAYDPDARSYCTLDARNLKAYLTAHSTKTYPYSCPAFTATPPTAGSNPGYSFTTYNQTGEVATSSDQIGDTTTTTYDAYGNATTVKNPDADVTKSCYYYQYDEGQCEEWQAAATIDSTRSISGVSCYSENSCMAVDTTGHVTAEATGTWGSASEKDATRHLTSVSCASSALCFAVDSTGHALKYSSGSWGSATAIDTSLDISSVSCPTTTHCVIVDSSGKTRSWTGSAWSAATTIDSGHALTSVSCINTPAFFCAAVDSSGRGFIYKTGAWGSAHTVVSGHSLTSVSCIREKVSGTWKPVCVAVDTAGKEFTNVNGTWSGSGTVSTGADLEAISCASENVTTVFMCDTTDSVGKVFTITQSPMFTYTVDATKNVDAVSCPLASSCTAVDASGRAMTTREGTGTASALWSTTSPVTQADAAGLVTTTSYDPGGATANTGTPSGMTKYAYDVAGDKTATTYATTASTYTAPHAVTSTYNQAQMPTAMSDGTGTTDYTYDAAGDLTSKTFTAGGSSGLSNKKMSFTYVAASELQSVTYPSYTGVTNPKASYAYNTHGEMASVTDWASNTIAFSHDRSGNLTQQSNEKNATHPTGTSHMALTYDAAGENTSVSTTYAATGTVTSCTITSKTHTYSMTSAHSGSRNADGQVTATAVRTTSNCKPTTSSPAVTNFTYDIDGRVTYGATGSGTHYGYDAAGNLTKVSKRVSGTWTTYTQTVDSAGEITKQTGSVNTTYTYNTIGDRTKSHTSTTTTTYTYNQAGDMTSAGPSGHRSTYVYDGLGNEAAYKSQGASTKTQLVWANPNGSLTLLYSNGADYFVYGPGTTPVEQYVVGTAKAIFLNYGAQDGLSSYAVTKTTGKLTKAYTYGPYGTLSGTTASVFGYAGEYTDSVGASPSGLVNMRARWYQPTTGTFMRVDPLVGQTHEPYEYATDNPVNNVDPSGLEVLACGGGSRTWSYFTGKATANGRVNVEGCIYWTGGYEILNANITLLYGDVWGQGLHGQLKYSSGYTSNPNVSARSLCNTWSTLRRGYTVSCRVAWWYHGYYYGLLWWNNTAGRFNGPAWQIVQIVGGRNAHL